MVFQNLRADLVQGAFDGLYLTDDVDAIGIFLHHADDSAQVAFDCLQSSDGAIVFHGYLKFPDTVIRSSLPPPQGGWVDKNIPYRLRFCQVDKCHPYRV